MTKPSQPALLALGDGLPPATRFCLVPDDGARMLAKPRLVAFVPCERFEGDGWHLLSSEGVLRTRQCRRLQNGGGIEVISSAGNKVFSAEQFATIVAGRLVGVAFLDFPSALLAVPFDAPPIKTPRRAEPTSPAGAAQSVKHESPADPCAIERAASEWAKLEEIVNRLGFEPVPMDRGFQRWMYLRPFMAWCISRGKRPADVRSDDVTLYIDGRRRTGGFALTKFKRAQMLRQAWNYAVQRFPGWSSQMLALDRPRRHTSVPVVKHGRLISFEIARYHPSLVAEVRAYRESGGFLGHEAPERPPEISHHERMLSKLTRLSTVGVGELLASSTHRQRRLCAKTLNEHGHLIYRAATALHLAGVADIQDLQHIADVATPQAAALLADRITVGWRAGTHPTSYAALSVYTLSAIARRCGVHYSIAAVMAVRDLAHELLRNVEMTRDLSTQNLDRLLQFDDRRVFSMLVALPDVVMKELEDDRANGRAVTLKWARRAETAIAIELLNTLPVRISTLVALDLKRNFVPPSHRKGDGKLIIYGDQEKSEKRLAGC